jgi:hypothetical protein
MNRLSRTLFAAAALIAAPVSTALAEGEDEMPEAPPDDGMTGDGTTDGTADAGMPVTDPAAPAEGAPMAGPPGLVLGAGKIVIAGSTLNINMSADAVGKPISLAPSVWYGVNEKLSVGLIHDGGTTMYTPRPAVRSFTAVILGMPITAAAGAGICITGEENGCPKFYDNVGVDALYSITADKLSIAGHGGLDVGSFDPFTLSLRAGVLGRYMASDKLAIVFDPRIKIGLTERDFNKEALDVPVWAWFMASDKLGVYLHTGINGPLDGFGDAFSIPVGVGASFMASDKLSVGGDFHFPNLAGKGSSADGRLLGVRAAYSL